MKELTKAEEQVMQILWNIEKGFVNDILKEMKEPVPAYNTVSTIVRILEKKGFVKHLSFGKSHQYIPILTRDEYSSQSINRIINGYFSNSFRQMVSFFTRKKGLSIQELEAIRNIMDEEIEKRKQHQQ